MQKTTPQHICRRSGPGAGAGRRHRRQASCRPSRWCSAISTASPRPTARAVLARRSTPNARWPWRREREREAAQGRSAAPLHGVPVAIKDIIDVEGLPTRANSRSRADAPPASNDAEIVLALKAAGAIVLGKVHTTEFAFFDPSPARNPAQHHAHPRRVEFGLGGGGRGRHGADCGGHADGRLGQPAGSLLRHLGLQAEHAQPVDASASRRWRHPTIRQASTAGAWTMLSTPTRRWRRHSCSRSRAAGAGQNWPCAFPTTRTFPMPFPR